jgi:hypothetical protein
VSGVQRTAAHRARLCANLIQLLSVDPQQQLEEPGIP